ncbi:MAG: hypothetical protein ACTHJ4_01800 [Candidatus Nucleicultricaceae bacterium]
MIKFNTIRTLCVAVAGAFILTTGYATIAKAEIVVKRTVIDRNIDRGLIASPIAPRVVKEKVVVHKRPVVLERKILRPRVEIDKKVVVRPRVEVDKTVVVK